MIITHNKSLLIVIVLIVISIIGYFIYKMYIKENFGLYDEVKSNTIVKQYYLVSSNPDMIVAGDIYKVKNNKSNSNSYTFEYNLPNPTGGDLESSKNEYQVLVGDSKESLKYIGSLKRSGDGFYRFKMDTPVDYAFIQIVLTNGDLDKKKIIAEKQLI